MIGVWGIRPPRGLWYHCVVQRPSPIPPCGRSGISLKCCAFRAAYAASYTQSVSHRRCLPALWELAQETLARSFRWCILNAHAANCYADSRSAGDTCKVASC